jgi:hypothetical protein
MSANGKLSATELVTVQGRIQLAPNTARAWTAARSVAPSSNVNMTIALPDGGYRSIATQIDMHVNPLAHNLNPASSVPLAAVGESSHGFGTCVDVIGVGAVAWLLAHGADYGFHRPSVTDPNHFSHNGLLSPETLAHSTTFTQGEPNVIIYIADTSSTDGVIVKGLSYIQEGSLGVLRPLGSDEYGAYDYWSQNGIPLRKAAWGGDAIRELSKNVGVMQHTALPNNRPTLTGKIIYTDPAKADYPRVSGLSAATFDQAALVAAVVAAIKFPTVPTAAQIATAAADENARRQAS